MLGVGSSRRSAETAEAPPANANGATAAGIKLSSPSCRACGLAVRLVAAALAPGLALRAVPVWLVRARGPGRPGGGPEPGLTLLRRAKMSMGSSLIPSLVGHGCAPRDWYKEPGGVRVRQSTGCHTIGGIRRSDGRIRAGCERYRRLRRPAARRPAAPPGPPRRPCLGGRRRRPVPGGG